MGSSSAFWYLPNQVIYVLNIGELTAEDFREVDRQIIALMRQGQANGHKKVHVFVDSTRLTKLPNLFELEGGRILHYMNEPACGWTIVVGKNNPFLTILSRFLTSVSKVNLYLCKTLEQGKTYAEHHLDLNHPLPDAEKVSEAYITRHSATV